MVYILSMPLILTDRHDLHHYQLKTDENLRIPQRSTTHRQLFIRYGDIKLEIIYLTIYVVHHHSQALEKKEN